MIIQHLPVLIVLCPLFGALICPMISYISRISGRVVVAVLTFCALVMSVMQLLQVKNTGEIHYWMGNWKPPYGIEFVIDPLNAVILVLIALMGFLTVLFGVPFQMGKSRFKNAGYFSILSLLITGLLGMTSTGDIFNLYVFLEITSLSGYALIAMGGDKGIVSAFRYLLIGTIGASFYLLGVAFLYGETGTLNMEDMSGDMVEPILSSGTTMVAMIFFVVGFGIKMALFPLHGWQPSAYTNSHPGAAPLIAGVMGKVPAYAMFRFFYFVFDVHNSHVHAFLVLVGVMASCGMIYGSWKAIQQKDLRKMLAYSSIAQMGYIGIGMAIGNIYGGIGAILHIINHSFMKGGLFFCAGAIQHKYGITGLDNLGQIYRKLPKTVTVMVLAALSMIGIPPTAGFFSKWYLALGAVQAGDYIYVAVLVVSSLLNAVYFFRLLEHIFMDKADETVEEVHKTKFEVSRMHLIPIVVCGVGILALGFANTWFVSLLTSMIQGVA